MEEIVTFKGGKDVMAADKHQGQGSDSHEEYEMPHIMKYRPNVSGLVALAGTIIAVSLVFHGIIGD